MRITSIFFHFQAYTGQFGFNTLSGILIFKQKCRFRRKIRSICPNFRCKILQKVYRCMLLLCELTVGRSFFIADSSSVKTENLSFLKLFLKKFFNRGNSGFTGPVKINPTACHLCSRLYKITSVCPKSGLFPGKNGCSCRTGESGHIFTEFEIISYILTMMKIRRRNNININTLLCHRTAKGIDPLLNIHANYLPICI